MSNISVNKRLLNTNWRQKIKEAHAGISLRRYMINLIFGSFIFKLLLSYQLSPWPHIKTGYPADRNLTKLISIPSVVDRYVVFVYLV